MTSPVVVVLMVRIGRDMKMSEYIDRELAENIFWEEQQELLKWKRYHQFDKDERAVYDHLEDYRDKIKALPIADVVDVVRCRDCKYWRDWQMAVASHGFGENMGECHCNQWDNEYFYYLTKDIDFCSYGERKE